LYRYSTVHTPYSPLYGTGRGFGMPRGVTPTSVPGLGETLGKALDDVLEPLPALSTQTQSRHPSVGRKKTGLTGVSEVGEGGVVGVGKNSGKNSGDETGEMGAAAAAATAAAAAGEKTTKKFDDVWGFDQLRAPVELPPPIRYAAAPDAPARDARPWTAPAADPTAAAGLKALTDKYDGGGGRRTEVGGGGAAAGGGGTVGGGGAGGRGQHPTWDDDDDGSALPSSRPGTSGGTMGRTTMMRVGAMTGGTGRRRPVVAVGPPAVGGCTS
jgi:hypothetical protein